MEPSLLTRPYRLKISWQTNYKVSRATIRSAFDRLEAMGLIIRRQGVGTFVRKNSNISNLLNQFIDFPRLIADNGYRARLQTAAHRIN